jgi:hypothetical protein
MAVIFLLAACAPAASAPTQDPAIVQQLIEQSVALTVAAQNAQTLEAQALIPAATNTPLPTQTAEVAPVIPTATPFVIVPPTLAPVTGGGGGGVPAPKPEYACDIINQKPFDNEVFKPNDTFDIKWTIVNTGTRTWKAGLDLKYFSGPEMTTTKFVELPEMKPGDKYSVVMDATAPGKIGFHVMTFVLEGPICYPYVAINVDK